MGAWVVRSRSHAFIIPVSQTERAMELGRLSRYLPALTAVLRAGCHCCPACRPLLGGWVGRCPLQEWSPSVQHSTALQGQTITSLSRSIDIFLELCAKTHARPDCTSLTTSTLKSQQVNIPPTTHIPPLCALVPEAPSLLDLYYSEL